MRRALAVMIAGIIFLAAPLLPGALIFSGCGPSYPAELHGTITLHGDSALPSGAVLRIDLIEVARQDAPPGIVTEQHMENPTGAPNAYPLSLEPERIDSKLSYYVAAAIEDSAGAPLYTSTRPTPVLTQGNPSSDVDVALYPVK
jgi:uncharacterized lipoprotein YbaY